VPPVVSIPHADLVVGSWPRRTCRCGAAGWNPRRARASVGDTYMLGMLVSGMTVYGRTTSPVDLFAGINEENTKMIARGRAHGAGSWSDQDIRKAIEDGDMTVTLADATVFPPGSPRYEVPLLRIRLAQVAGWWLVPTDAEGKASFTHPSACLLAASAAAERGDRSTARPLSTPAPSLALPDAGSRYQTAIVLDPDRYIEHVFDSRGFRLSETGAFVKVGGEWLLSGGGPGSCHLRTNLGRAARSRSIRTRAAPSRHEEQRDRTATAHLSPGCERAMSSCLCDRLEAQRCSGAGSASPRPSHRREHQLQEDRRTDDGRNADAIRVPRR
jgi:hypothetical protein